MTSFYTVIKWLSNSILHSGGAPRGTSEATENGQGTERGRPAGPGHLTDFLFCTSVLHLVWGDIST